MNRDIYQKIAEQSDDRTALSLLSSHRGINNDIYYDSVFRKRYPELINYRKEGESLKHLYLRMLEIIGILKEELNITYKEGNPENILFENINKLLLHASKTGKIKLINYALEKGADINFLNRALVWASVNGHLEAVKYLIERGADISANNYSAFKAASEMGQLEIVKYLSNKIGEDVLNTNAFFDALDLSLDRAKDNGQIEVVAYLKSLNNFL